MRFIMSLKEDPEEARGQGRGSTAPRWMTHAQMNHLAEVSCLLHRRKEVGVGVGQGLRYHLICGSCRK